MKERRISSELLEKILQLINRKDELLDYGMNRTHPYLTLHSIVSKICKNAKPAKLQAPLLTWT